MAQKIYGNKKALQTLTFIKKSGRLCHAYLITGEQGLGKKTFARYMAEDILCRAGEDAPCGACESCRKMEANAHPDFIVTGGGGGKNSLHIDEIRALRADAFIRPNESEYKVYGIFDCDDMTIGAANALLKVLEEPPRYAVFLLTCKNPGTLPETIRSRCIEIPLSPVSQEECLAALAALSPDTPPETAAEAARAAEGNIGEALGFLSAKEGELQETLSIARGILAGIAKPGEYDLLCELARCGTSREKAAGVLEQAAKLLRGAMLCKAKGETPEEEPGRSLCLRLTAGDFLEVLEVIGNAREGLDKNASPALLLTWVSARIKSIV